MTFTCTRRELFSASDWSESLKLTRWVALYPISHFTVYWRLSLQYSPCFWAVCVAETVWYLPPVLHYLILVLFCYSDSLKHHVPQWWYCCMYVKNNQCIDILYFPQVIRRIQQVVFLVSMKQWYFIECFWRCTHNTVYIAFFFFLIYPSPPFKQRFEKGKSEDVRER